MYCRYCGKEIDADSVYCQYCGRKLVQSASYDKTSFIEYPINIENLQSIHYETLRQSQQEACRENKVDTQRSADLFKTLDHPKQTMKGTQGTISVWFKDKIQYLSQYKLSTVLTVLGFLLSIYFYVQPVKLYGVTLSLSIPCLLFSLMMIDTLFFEGKGIAFIKNIRNKVLKKPANSAIQTVFGIAASGLWVVSLLLGFMATKGFSFEGISSEVILQASFWGALLGFACFSIAFYWVHEDVYVLKKATKWQVIKFNVLTFLIQNAILAISFVMIYMIVMEVTSYLVISCMILSFEWLFLYDLKINLQYDCRKYKWILYLKYILAIANFICLYQYLF